MRRRRQGLLHLYAGSYVNGTFDVDDIDLPNGILSLASYDNRDTIYNDGSDYGFILSANNVAVASGSAIEADGPRPEQRAGRAQQRLQPRRLRRG
jgi:hypothetical protein